MLAATDEALQSLWDVLLLPSNQDEATSCRTLCTAVLAHYQRSGVVLPEKSGVGCYTLEGETRCDVDLSEAALKAMASVLDLEASFAGPASVAEVPGSGGLAARGRPVVAESLAHLGGSEDAVPPPAQAQRDQDAEGRDDSGFGGTGEAIARLANWFQVFPPVPGGVSVVTPPQVPGTADSLLTQPSTASVRAPPAQQATAAEKVAIAEAATIAYAWTTAVSSQMRLRNTTRPERTWFGGSGSQSLTSVRGVVSANLATAGRLLYNSPNFVWPADAQTGSPCAKNTGTSGVSGYVTVVPGGSPRVCDPATKSPFANSCSVDNKGRHYIYLCKWWYQVYAQSPYLRATTVVHEAAHHAGAFRDVSYDDASMKKLSQSDQLANAANYENFARDVAESSWGCRDDDTYVYRQGTVAYPCSQLVNLCKSHVPSLAQVPVRCKATCGLCPKVSVAR